MPEDFRERAQRRRRPPESGTGKLGPTPFERRAQARPGAENGSSSQENAFVVRLDPHAKPGEFNFVISDPTEAKARVPQASGLVAEASGGIPPVLHAAVDEVLGFIYNLDQQFESRTRKPRK